jgi:hypothetical protein
MYQPDGFNEQCLEAGIIHPELFQLSADSIPIHPKSLLIFYSDFSLPLLFTIIDL